MNDTPLDVFREIFEAAPFLASLGVELDAVEKGRCRTSLRVRPDHLQQTGVVHAGVIATLADHTAGGAAGSVLAAGCYPLTVEFKINLLRATRGPRLVCEGRVLRAGRALVVAESEVFSREGEEETLVAKAILTLVVRAKEKERRGEGAGTA